ncbi:hypothetical protein BH23CHL2_BH23CHL2_01190 [soil metagenome]
MMRTTIQLIKRPLIYMMMALMLAPSIAISLPRPAAAQTTVPIDVPVPADQVVYEDFSSDRVRDGHISTVGEYRLSMVQGELVTIETANISEGGDPVLHLLETNGQQLAVNDNGAGGTAARIVYHSDADKTVIVLVRSKSQNSAGAADLLKNGEVWKSGVKFAGWHNSYANLPNGEHLRTVQQPGGSTATHRIYILKPDKLGIELRVSGGGPGGAAAAYLHADYVQRTVIVGVGHPNDEGRARLIRNDVNNDADFDGLGDGLEAALGTCSSLSGFVRIGDGYEFDCSLAADPRDTDGDGISDGVEVFGLLVNDQVVVADSGAQLAQITGPDVEYSFQKHINLPLWGADPRHKDLFIEVDFMMRMPGETEQRLSPDVARQFAAYYQDTLDDPSPLIDLYRAVSLRNPDGQRGINVHLDTGVDPETPEDATIYGDWGGFNAVEPLQKDDGSYGGANPQTAWQENMHEARRGIFRYILAYPGGGGQNPINSFAGSGPMNNAWVLAHEFAHAMGLAHSGPPGATGVVDPNCKPNYTSLLNYAYQSAPDVGFSDGLGNPPLNNAALVEWEAVSPGNTSYLDQLESIFKYYVDREHGHVDWNRDGEFAPEGTTVRAYANYRPAGGGCEFTRYNQSYIENAASYQSPAMARLGNRLYTFYSVLGSVYYTYSTDAGNCPEPSKEACATWSDPEIAYMDAQGGVDVVRAGDALLIVTIDKDGAIWERRLSLNGAGNEQWTDHRQIAGRAAPAEGLDIHSEPALSDLGYCKIFLAYRGADGNVRHNKLSCADGFVRWSGEQLSLDQNGNPIPMANFSAPGIDRAYLGEPGLASVYGAFADVNGYLNLYRYNEEANRWELTDLLEGNPGPVEGRPALQWTSENVDIDYPGKFYLMYVQHDSYSNKSFRNRDREVRMMMSYVKVEQQGDGSLSKSLKVGLNGSFDNVWLHAYGIDLFFEAGVDSNLRAVLSRSSGNPDHSMKIQFRPKADGINDFRMNDYNDWDVLRIGLCKHVVNPGGLISNPITCPAG